MATIEQGTCRIKINGIIKGTGFLISGHYILTCSHVLLRYDDKGQLIAPIETQFKDLKDANSDTTITISFPKTEDKHEIKATFVNATTLDPEDYTRDIAVLHITEVPSDTIAFPWNTEPNIIHHTFTSLGFPKGNAFGANTEGLIKSNQFYGVVQLQTHKDEALQIDKGFSGGVVLDTKLNSVIGMIVAGSQRGDAYCIPMRLIIRVWQDEFKLPPLISGYFTSNPYKGLDYFHTTDADRFYGRDEEIASLYKKIEQQDFIAVVGNSGTGKSSVVFAGLVPKLDEAAWCVLATRPADDPFHYLAKALVDHFEKDLSDLKKISEIKDYKAKLKQGSLTLADVATMEKDSRARQLVVIIDQFEELYTLNQDKAEDVQAYLEHLMAAIESKKLHLIITLRTDFLSNTHQTPDFAKLIEAHKHNIYLIKEADKLAEIIALPDAQGRARVQLEAGLKEKIIKDAKGELALLQFALEELWQRRENNSLTHAAYTAIGGVDGALERKAESFMETLPEEEQQQVRLIMLKLLKLGEGTEDTRRIATKAEIGEDNWAMVSRLAGERLIKSKESDGEATAEVIHEALIRNWQTLKEWLTTDVREFLRWRENLKYQFNKWQSTQKPPSALLTGLWLTMARQYQQELNGSVMNNFNQLLNDSQKSYIQHSITSEQEKRQKEEMDREKLQRALNEVEGQKNIILGLQLVYRAKDTLFYSKSLHDYSTVGQLMLCESIPLLESSNFYNDDFLTTTVSALQRELKLELWGHSQGVKDICFSSNGEFLASAGYDKSIILWDLKIGENTTLFKHNQNINSICFSPNGKLLACACDETLRVLDIEQRKCIAVFECESVIRKVDFGSNDELLACACDENLEIWHITKGARSFASQNKFAQPTDIQFSPNNKLLASTHYDGNILLWHINQKNNDDAIRLSEGEAIPRRYEEAITSLDFTSDGRHLLITSYNGYITLWSIQGKIQEVYSMHYDKSKEYIQLTDSAFNPDRKSFVISAEDASLQVYDIETGNIQNILSGHSAKVTRVAFRANGELASASQDGSIKIWDYVHPQRFMDIDDILLHGYDSGSFITSLCTDAQERLFVGDSDGILSTYDLTNKSLSVLNTPVICSSIIDMDISADNSLLAIAKNDGTIQFWDVTNDEKLKTYITHNELGKIRVNSSKDFLALVHNTTLEVVTNVQDYLYHNQEASLMKCKHSDRVKIKYMCFSPTDKYLLAYVDSNDTLRLWNIKTNKLEIFPTTKGNIVRGLSKQKPDIYEVDWLGFDPKGELLIFISGRREVQFWCLESHRLKFKLMHEGVKHVRLSPVGRFLITIAKDNEIKLWNMIAKKEITNLPTYNNNNIDFVDFIFDSTTLFLLIASKNGKIHIVDLTIAHWIDKLCHNTGRNFFKPEWQEYLTHFITWEDYVARGGTCSQYPVLESIEDYANLNN